MDSRAGPQTPGCVRDLVGAAEPRVLPAQGASSWILRASLVGIGLTFAVLALTAATLRVSDPDVFWVAAAGRYLLHTGQLPHTNLWAITDAAHPWVFHEWLFGVPYAWILGHLGVGWLPLLGLLGLTTTFALLLWATLGRSRTPVGAVLGLFALLCFSMRALTPRTTHLALAFPLLLWVLSSRPLRRWRAVAIVALEWLWANAHGSFPLGWAILALSVIELPAERRKRLGLLGATVAVTVVNPYGLKLHRLVLGYLAGGDATSRFIHRHIAEFQPLWRAPEFVLTRGAMGCEVLFLIALILQLLAHPRFRARIGFALLLLVGAALQVRHLDLAGLLGCALFVEPLDELWTGHLRRTAGQSAVLSSRSTAGLLGLLLVPGLLIGGASWAREYRQHRSDGSWVSPTLGGSDVVALAKALPDGAHVLPQFTAGGIVLWYGADRGVKVLFDPRNDCYSAATATTALSLLDGLHPPPEAERELDAAKVDRVLVPASSPLAQELARSALWHVRARAGTWASIHQVSARGTR